MLVLTRKPGQSIMIGDGVEIQVLSVSGEKVRLGVTAPREVGIFRNEVYERISEEREGESQEGERKEGERKEEEREDEGSHRAALGRFAIG
jgi:carbon storage regulator